MTHLTAIILTYNESRHIVACIEHVRFADAVLVFDSFSTDDTVTLARGAGAEVIQHAFSNYSSQRNAALASVADKTNWVLFVDADERVDKALADEILAVIATDEAVGWRLPRHNYIFGKLTHATGWYPDYQTRLLKIGFATYDPTRMVHEVVILDGALGTLKTPLIHYNYDNARQFAQKQRKYTAYEAKIMYEGGIRPKLRNYILQPLRHFKWRFVELQGYKDGLHGLRLSLLMSWYEFKKYSLLRGLWRKK
jgi:glycosyltransferase involved in cell wall biosynthesis